MVDEAPNDGSVRSRRAVNQASPGGARPDSQVGETRSGGLAGMAEAARLAHAGKVTEATRLIQRMLGITKPVTARPTSSQRPGRISPASQHLGHQAPHPPPVVNGDPSPGAIRVALPHTRPHTRARPTSPRVPSRLGEVRAPGQSVTGSFSNSQGSRAYKLYVPTSYTGKPAPLLVMLHGCTQTVDDFAAGTGMNRLAEAHTFLVAYPMQPSSANARQCWNWFRPSDQRRDIGEPALLVGIVRQIMSTHAVDTRRVYVAGASSGAAMALILAETYPELFSAAGAHSGVAPGAAHDLLSAFVAMRGARRRRPRPRENDSGTGDSARQRVPIIVFHGDGDRIVNQANADHIVDHWIVGAVGRPKEEMRVAQEHGQAAGGHAYTRTCYSLAGGAPFIEQWIVHHLRHAWSGGLPPASYTDPKGPDASAEMVRFFFEHPRRR